MEKIVVDTLKATLAVMLAALLGACATHPTGPSVMALPGTGMTFDQFRFDDSQCQLYAQQATGTSAQAAGEKSAADTAVVGTVVGAAAGALIGSASGDAGQGAAVGAGTGLVLGSAAAADSYATSGSRLQERYDTAYVQCMYGRGHQVPVPASAANASRAQGAAQQSGTPAAKGGYPPPGTPPPPGY